MTNVPPQNIEAEQSVLGAILLDKEAIYTAMDILQPDHFYREAHRIIYEVMTELANKNEPIDLITVSDTLKQKQLLNTVGGASYIAELGDSVPTAANIEHYAKIVKQKSVLRTLIQHSYQTMQKAYAEEFEDINDFIAEAQAGVLNVNHDTKDDVVPIKQIVSDQLETIFNRKSGELQGLTTGIRKLDLWTTGLYNSDFIVIAARPSMGKTALALGIADINAKKRKTVVIFSLETSRGALVERLISSNSMVDGQKIRTGMLSDDDIVKVTNAGARLFEMPLYIIDKPGISVAEMRSRCRKVQAREGLDLIAVDYLQLVTGKGENRTQEVSGISRDLKALAKEFDVPVIALSQLSRAVEQTSDKRPNLSHLRESGSIEQDADVVAFIYRPEYYFPDTEKKGIAEIILAKQRNGPVGTVEVAWLKQFTKFADLAKEV